MEIKIKTQCAVHVYTNVFECIASNEHDNYSNT